jgi:hypothetical protein
LIELAADEDHKFLFAATQTGQSPQGNTINQCHLTFTLKRKAIRDEVEALRSVNPWEEILQVDIADGSFHADFFVENIRIGQAFLERTRTTTGITPIEGDLFEFTFDTAETILLYDALKFNASARLDLSCNALSPPTVTAFEWVFSFSLPFGRTFAAERYQAAYTVTVGQATWLIFHRDDLASFNASQSEFQEFIDLGNVNQRYPSIRRPIYQSSYATNNRHPVSLCDPPRTRQLRRSLHRRLR